MRTLTKMAAAAFATALIAGLAAAPAGAEPRPENPNKKTHTSRTVACEWRDPGTNRDKFTKLTVKFLLIDGEAFMIRGYNLRGKTAKNPISFIVANHDGINSGTRDGVVVGSGLLDERGRAGTKTRHVITGDTVTVMLATSEFDLLDPTTWVPDLCVASMEVPY